MSASSLITLRARLADGLGQLAANLRPAILLAGLFAVLDLIAIKLFLMLDPDLAETVRGRRGPGEGISTVLLIQTLVLMLLVGHSLIWARICLLGRARALAGGIDAFLRRFSVCLTRLMVAAMLGIAISFPALLLAVGLTQLFQGAGEFGRSVALATWVMMLAVPLGAVASGLILSLSAEAIDRRLSMLAAMQQTQPAWTRLAIVMIVIGGLYGLMLVGLFWPLAGAEARIPATFGGSLLFLAQQALGFLTLALAIGALAPLLRDRKKRKSADPGQDPN